MRHLAKSLFICLVLSAGALYARHIVHTYSFLGEDINRLTLYCLWGLLTFLWLEFFAEAVETLRKEGCPGLAPKHRQAAKRKKPASKMPGERTKAAQTAPSNSLQPAPAREPVMAGSASPMEFLAQAAQLEQDTLPAQETPGEQDFIEPAKLGVPAVACQQLPATQPACSLPEQPAFNTADTLPQPQPLQSTQPPLPEPVSSGDAWAVADTSLQAAPNATAPAATPWVSSSPAASRPLPRGTRLTAAQRAEREQQAQQEKLLALQEAARQKQSQRSQRLKDDQQRQLQRLEELKAAAFKRSGASNGDFSEPE